jgi:hypothetical protein
MYHPPHPTFQIIPFLLLFTPFLFLLFFIYSLIITSPTQFTIPQKLFRSIPFLSLTQILPM